MKNLRNMAVLFLTFLLCGVATLSEISCGLSHISSANFTDNGNDTVTDNISGRMWQKQDDGNLYNWYHASGEYDATYNPDSKNVCGDLELGGYHDWRLPSKDELLYIADYTRLTIGTVYFLDTKAAGYWSSTLSKRWSGTYVCLVGFQSGKVTYHHKYGYGYVRCIR